MASMHATPVTVAESSSESESESDDDLGITWKSALKGVEGHASESSPSGAGPGVDASEAVERVVAHVTDQARKRDARRASKDRKKKSKKKKNKERIRQELVHRMELLALVAASVRWNNACDQPDAFAQAAAIMPLPFQRVESEKRLRLLVAWFADTFKTGTEIQSSLSHVLKLHSGSRRQIVQAFVICARAVGIACRLVSALYPSVRIKSSTLPKKRKRDDHKSDEQVDCWVEVLVVPEDLDGKQAAPIDLDGDKPDEPSCRWICVDPVLNYVGKSLERAEFCPYVLALGAGNYPTDVTARYAKRWTQTVKERHSERDGWWRFYTLLPLGNAARQWLFNCTFLNDKQRHSFQHAISQTLVTSEEAQLEAAKSLEAMPTNQEAFRRHERFILSTLFTRNQGLVPGAHPVGVFKGQQVYLREHMADLLSKTKWRQEARVVRESELDHPAKLVPRRFQRDRTLQEAIDSKEARDSPSSDEEDENSTATDKISLYGKWQTDPYIPPVVGADGRIPKTEYGNVEMWCAACCPIGAVHLREAMVGKAAVNLGLEYAPALVGFERRDGRQLPKFDGIVVASCHAQMLKDAAAALVQEAAEKKAQKRLEAILARWVTLTRAVLVTARLTAQYGCGENVPPLSEGARERRSAEPGAHSDSPGTAPAASTLVARNQACAHAFRSAGGGHQGTKLVCAKCGVTKFTELL